jgi:hypothetical protein
VLFFILLHLRYLSLKRLGRFFRGVGRRKHPVGRKVRKKYLELATFFG